MKQLRTHSILIAILAGFVGLVLTGYLVWCAILTDRVATNKGDISSLEENVKVINTDVSTLTGDVIILQEDVTIINNEIGELNASIDGTAKLVASKVRLSANVDNLTNTENLPFDTLFFDTDALFNTTSHEWTVDRDGGWFLTGCGTWDLTSMPDFSPAIANFDIQIQIYINDAFSAFLSTSAFSINSTFVQQWTCGSQLLELTAGTTVALRVQARLFPVTIVNSYLSGGPFATTMASLSLWGLT